VCNATSLISHDGDSHFLYYLATTATQTTTISPYYTLGDRNPSIHFRPLSLLHCLHGIFYLPSLRNSCIHTRNVIYSVSFLRFLNRIAPQGSIYLKSFGKTDVLMGLVVRGESGCWYEIYGYFGTTS